MYATLAWSATHITVSDRHIDGISDPSRMITCLKGKSVEHLRTELQELGMKHGDALLATVRTLCQYEIHSGSDGNSVWRVHVKGAKALMTTIKTFTKFEMLKIAVTMQVLCITGVLQHSHLPHTNLHRHHLRHFQSKPQKVCT